MDKTAWQYSVYTSPSWGLYADFTSNPGRTAMTTKNVSTVEYKRLIDGSEIDVCPETLYNEGDMAWTWLNQKNDTLFDTLNGWYTAHTAIRIKDDASNVYEGYFLDVAKILTPRKSYTDGSQVFYITTKFKRLILV